MYNTPTTHLHSEPFSQSNKTKIVYWEFPLLDELNIPDETILIKMDSRLYVVYELGEE